MKSKFLEKGYKEQDLETALMQADSRNRADLLVPRERESNDDFQFAFFSSYSVQHFSVKKLIRKHWHILKNDSLLGPVLPEAPKVIFRGVPPLRLQVAPNIVDPPKTISFFQERGGFYPCRGCATCKVNACRSRRVETFFSNATQRNVKIKPFITCSTRHVVYLLRCPCGREYVGRTIRKLHVRLQEHVANILKAFPKHSVSRHYDECHGNDPKGTVFLGIDKFSGSWRGSNRTRGVSQLETSWIYRLKTYAPHGLNIDWDINSFINNA